MMVLLIILKALLVAVISGLFYRFGGTDQWKWCPINQKLWRGPILGAIVGAILWNGWLAWGLTIGLYWGLPGLFPYGEKGWPIFKNFSKTLSEHVRFAINGVAFGVCAMFCVSPITTILQGIISGLSFVGIKMLDDKNIIKNPWVERARGFMGTIIL